MVARLFINVVTTQILYVKSVHRCILRSAQVKSAQKKEDVVKRARMVKTVSMNLFKCELLKSLVTSGEWSRSTRI